MTISAATIGLPVTLGVSLEEVDSSTTVDDVFVFESDSKKWCIVFDGGITLYRTSWLIIGNPPTDKTTLFNIILSNTDIKTIEIDTDIQLAGTVNVGGRTLSIISNGKLSGTFTLQNAEISADPLQHIFDGPSTLTNCKSRTGVWYATWFGAKGDGSSDDYTALDNCIDVANSNQQKTVNLISGNYLIESNLTVPSGVTLQFEIGAKISGDVTIYGNGNFDSKPHHIFDVVTINGLYPLSGEITPQQFGAVGDNIINDSPAFQKMWDYVATLTTTAIVIFIPARVYYTPDTIYLPKTALAVNKYIIVKGYGVTLRTNVNNPIFSRHSSNMSEATANLDSYKCTIEGISFEGNSTVIADQANQIGLDISSAYTWEVKNCFFYRLYKGIEAQFWLNGKITNCHFTQNYYCDIMGRYGDWTDANAFNTAFNSNQIIGCRFFSTSTSFTTVYLLGADQTVVRDCISEGLNPLYNFYFDYAGSTVVNVNIFENIWFESVGGTNTQNTNFYLRAAGEIHLKNIQRELPNRFFEIAANSSAVVALIVDGAPYFSNLPSSGLTAFSRNGSVNADWKFIFKNIYTGVVGGLLPPEIASNWDGGTLPISLFIDTYTGVGGGATLSQRKSNLTEVISAQSVILKNTLRAGVNFRGLAINMPQSTNGVPSVSSTLLGITDLTPTIPSASLIGSQRHVFFYGQGTNANTGTQFGTCYSGNTTDEGRTSIFSHLVSRGTLVSPVAVNNTVTLGIYRTQSFDGTNVITTGLVKWLVDGTVSTGIIPTSFEVQVMNSSGVLQNPLKIRSSGQIELAVTPAAGALTDALLVRTSAGELKQINSNLLGLSGSYSDNGDNIQTIFTVTHSLGSIPSQVLITPTSIDTAISFYVTNKTSITFDVVFTTAPVTGTANIKFDWLVK